MSGFDFEGFFGWLVFWVWFGVFSGWFFCFLFCFGVGFSVCLFQGVLYVGVFAI